MFKVGLIKVEVKLVQKHFLHSIKQELHPDLTQIVLS